jgi:hypothetical protein
MTPGAPPINAAARATIPSVAVNGLRTRCLITGGPLMYIDGVSRAAMR